MWKGIALATLVAGTLDILSAFVFAGQAGGNPGGVLRYVASGPLGDSALKGGAGAAAAGLAVHFAIMAVMVLVYFLVARRVRSLLEHPVIAGLLYGLLLWAVMYWVVKPLRWPDAPLPSSLVPIAKQLFAHCVLTGLPIALIASWSLRNKDLVAIRSH